MGSSWGAGYRHHESMRALQESSSTCEMCSVLFSDLSPLLAEAAAAKDARPDLCEGWLGLYPWWESGRVGANRRNGYFRAGFRKGLSGMRLGTDIIGAVPLHTFRVCRRRGENEDIQVEEDTVLGEYTTAPVPPTLTPAYIADKVKKWQSECLDKHEACATKHNAQQQHALPTRVLDLGVSATDNISIYEAPRDQAEDYAALSHCWGGHIPARTITANLGERMQNLDVNGLPQNFRDAIWVSRALEIRYLWIDALCIIQDSSEDWFREARQMSSIYAGAKIVISALDSPSSTMGFLHQDRIPQAVVSDRYAVQKHFGHVYEYLKTCPLTTRAWCMQERLLAPTVLHIGSERMLWECQKHLSTEDGQVADGQSTGNVMGQFIALRGRLGREEQPSWREWYHLLEEYTTRNLTVESDKLPALAGAAALFQRPHKPSTPATYLAGLWKEDLARGLLWGASYEHVPGRPVWGYQSSDKCQALALPKRQGDDRAPSWSWASLDGQIDHWALRIGDGEHWYEILEVAIDSGENDPACAQPVGSVRIKGPLEQVHYLPHPAGGDVGSLEFPADQSAVEEVREAPKRKGKGKKGANKTFGGCVLDLDRHSPRDCWALIATRSNSDRFMLVLEDRGDGTFRRIGFCTAYGFQFGRDKFPVAEVVVR
ncbi:heterokaryon incompatibility protein-domain-containing protein [Microdochium bolleyi]|uniref:Heterokaryon incompatibility protein-domain-containing protein n=1 Tax=Microdochium bolleyi TaxID=196109 RepID=A0A136JFB2_9PEZI|nr:heterokaryon incompatibility protein-domain-containing protein [Microdochium bolleyi]